MVSLGDDATRTYAALIELFGLRFPTCREGEVLLWTWQQQSLTETVERFATRLIKAQRRAMGVEAQAPMGKKLLVENFVHGLRQMYRDRLLDKLPPG